MNKFTIATVAGRTLHFKPVMAFLHAHHYPNDLDLPVSPYWW